MHEYSDYHPSDNSSKDLKKENSKIYKKAAKTKRKSTKYAPCSKATVFDFSTLIKKVRKKLKNKYSNLSIKEYNALFYKAIKTFELNGQKFDFKCRDNTLAGFRWYVMCPKCKNTAEKLYLPKDLPNREPLYLCKDCHLLRNDSVLYGQTKKYKEVLRPLRQLEEIKKKLIDSYTDSEKTTALLDEYEQIEKKLKESPTYRLWKFKKEHKKSVITE